MQLLYGNLPCGCCADGNPYHLTPKGILSSWYVNIGSIS
jgi:hypothetical protein